MKLKLVKQFKAFLLAAKILYIVLKYFYLSSDEHEINNEQCSIYFIIVFKHIQNHTNYIEKQCWITYFYANDISLPITKGRTASTLGSTSNLSILRGLLNSYLNK